MLIELQMNGYNICLVVVLFDEVPWSRICFFFRLVDANHFIYLPIVFGATPVKCVSCVCRWIDLNIVTCALTKQQTHTHHQRAKSKNGHNIWWISKFAFEMWNSIFLHTSRTFTADEWLDDSRRVVICLPSFAARRHCACVCRTSRVLYSQHQTTSFSTHSPHRINGL